MIGSKLMLVLGLFALAQTINAKPQLQDYGALPAVSQMAVAPDGSMVAFRKVVDDKDLLVVYSLKKKKTLQMVNLAEINPEGIYFVSNAYLVIRVADTKHLVGTGEKYRYSAAYALNVESGELEQLLRPGDRIYTDQFDVGNIVGISADKKSVFMPAYIDPNKNPSSDLSMNFEGPFFLALMKVDLASPSSPKRAERGRKDTIDYFMGKNGKALVQELYGDHSNKHIVLSRTGKKWKTIYEQEEELRTKSFLGLSSDYASLVYAAFDNNGVRKFYTMDLKTGAAAELSENKSDRSVDWLLQDVNRLVHGIRFAGFKASYKMFDKKADKIVQLAVSKFAKDTVDIMHWDSSWSNVLFRVTGPSSPGDYYLMDGKGNLTYLGSERPNIKAEDIHPITSINISARDGLVIPTLLTIPRDQVANLKNLPLVVLPHGGPRSYDKIQFDWLAQALANEGYMVVQPQFRGSEGFGWTHIEAGYGEWGKKMQDDITDTVNYLIDHKVVDKERICIAGFSYGGYAALAGGAFTPELYRCVVSINGVSDLPAFISNKKHDTGRYSDAVAYLREAVVYEPGSKTLNAISPSKNAENFQAPVLLMHGEYDRNVRVDQSRRMASALKKADKEHELIVLKKENHYVDEPDTRMMVVEKVVGFVKKHLH